MGEAATEAEGKLLGGSEPRSFGTKLNLQRDIALDEPLETDRDSRTQS